MLNIDNYSLQDWLAKLFLTVRRTENPRLASRSLLLDFKNPWRILTETPVASLCDAPNFGENANFEFGLCLLNKIRTFFQQNPDSEF
jgi:hypothetical protein